MMFLNSNAKNPADSLQTILRSNPHDTTKFDIYINLYRSLYKDNLQEAMHYTNKAVALSEKIGDKKRICIANIKLARCYDQLGQLPEALDALSKAEKQLGHFRDTKIEAEFFMMRGIIYYFEGAYNMATKDLWDALIRYERMGDTNTVASCYLTIGTSNMELGNLDSALDYYLKALQIYKEQENEIGISMASGNLGIIYRRKGDYDRALEFSKQSLEVNKKYGLNEEIKIDLNNIGVILINLGNYELAREYLNQNLAIETDSHLSNLDPKFNLAIIEFNLKNYNKAVHDFYELIESAKLLNSKPIIRDCYKALSDAYQEMGKHLLALEHRREYEIWKDSLLTENHLKQVKELELQYETEKKDKQITLLAKEKELQEKETMRQASLKQAFVGGFILLFLLASLIVYILRQRIRNQKLLAKKNEEVKLLEFKKKMSELELKALRAQINPHFCLTA